MRGEGARPRAYILLLMYWQRQTPLSSACPKHIYGPISFPPFHWVMIHQACSHWPGTELQGCMLRARRHLVTSQRMTYVTFTANDRQWGGFESPTLIIVLKPKKKEWEIPTNIFKTFLHGISNIMVFVTFLVHLLCVRQASNYLVCPTANSFVHVNRCVHALSVHKFLFCMHAGTGQCGLRVQAAAVEDVDGSHKLVQLQGVASHCHGVHLSRSRLSLQAVRSLRLLMTRRPYTTHLVLHHRFMPLTAPSVCVSVCVFMCCGMCHGAVKVLLWQILPPAAAKLYCYLTGHWPPMLEAVCHNNDWPHLATFDLDHSPSPSIYFIIFKNVFFPSK